MAKAKGDSKSKPRSTNARKKKTVEPTSRGLTAGQVAAGAPPATVEKLQRAIEEVGGKVLGAYREPLEGHWHVLASLPIDKVAPTPFQRDLSENHVGRLADVIDRTSRFLDPIVVVQSQQGAFWTPNGHHRLAAMQRLGARSIIAVVVPDAEVAYQILALNTEKGHNLREKSLEVIRMARSLADLDPRPEKEFALEFEEPAFLTLGLTYEQRGRFAGGAYHPLLRRVDEFLAQPLPKALETRNGRAAKLLELDDRVNEAVSQLKERGFTSPYLKTFVVARINPLRFQRRAKASFDETIEAMLKAVRRFDATKVQVGDLAAASGPPVEE
ncbi:MAG: ParB/RepB/Spo0J family partition protein [Thermoguttaceae bacterium]|jgi:ParB family chromosome partitioning protein